MSDLYQYRDGYFDDYDRLKSWDQKIEFIKYLRAQYNIGLYAAKMYSEYLQDHPYGFHSVQEYLGKFEGGRRSDPVEEEVSTPDTPLQIDATITFGVTKLNYSLSSSSLKDTVVQLVRLTEWVVAELGDDD